MTLQRGAAAAVGGVILIVTTAANACPSCATRDAAGLGVFALVGCMIAVPYVVAVVAIKIVRRLDSPDGKDSV